MATTAQLAVDILARDKTGPAFSSAERRAHKFRGALVGAGSALAGIGLAQFAKDSVAAFADAETSQKSLEGAFKRFPKLADVNIESLRNLNQQMQSKTKFDGDDLAMMQSKLAAFNLTGSKIAELTPLIADYSQATGKDLNASALAVGKAMMGNVKALKSLGIEYKATGNKAKDAAKIQELLNSKVGGSTAAVADTAAVKLAIFNNQIGDLKESVGEGLLPALTKLVEVMTPIANAFASLPGPVKTGTIAVVGLAAAYNFLSPALGGVKGAIAGVAKLFGMSTGATIADTAATNANTAAKRANALAAPGGGAPGAAAKSAPMAAAGTAAASVLGFAAASVAATEATKRLAASGHTVASKFLGAALAGTTFGMSLKGLKEGQNQAADAQANIAARTNAVDRAMTKLASGAGGPKKVGAALAALKTKVPTAEFQAVTRSMPGLQSALAKTGYRVNQVTGAIERIPSSHNTNVTAETDAAFRKLLDLRSLMGTIQSKTVSIDASISGNVNRATGGPASGMVTVGERGPELVSLPPGSQVFSHDRSLHMGMANYATGSRAQRLAKWKSAMSKKYMPNLATLKDKRATLMGDYASKVSEFGSGSSSFANLGGMDFAASGEAQSEYADAQRAYNQSAVGSSDRSEAYVRLQAARQKAADTPSTPAAWIAVKLAKLKKFAASLGSLNKLLGASALGKTVVGKQLLMDVINAGPEGGTQLADALASGGQLEPVLAAMRDINGQVSAVGNLGAAADYAASHGNASYSGALAAANRAVNSQQAAINIVYTTKVIMDGKQIAAAVHKELLRQNRASGGRRSGL